MNNSDVREFLDALEECDEARQLAARRRRDDEEIDELIELCRAQVEGRTTHRSVATATGIERDTAFRAIGVLTETFGWSTLSVSSSGP